MTDKISIFVCCHKRFAIPEDPLLTPIQVGASLAEEHYPGFLADDTGENISDRNRAYCELTAQYWAWKNHEAAYYGFFHYRRFLYPGLYDKRPYRIEGAPTRELLKKLGFTAFPQLIKGHELILPRGEDMHVSVRDHYRDAPYHHLDDLERVEQIVRELHPECAEAMERYFSGSLLLFGNLYIMRRDVFHDYCAWLFPILEAFDRQTDVSAYGPQERRVDGYLAERLLGVYSTWRRDELKTLELPRVHFISDMKERMRLKTGYLLLPPGTKRRAYIKRLDRGF